MTIVSSKEFATNQEKYFDIAENEQVYIRRGKCMYIVARVQEHYKEPDDDLRRAVSLEIVKERLQQHVHQLFANQ